MSATRLPSSPGRKNTASTAAVQKAGWVSDPAQHQQEQQRRRHQAVAQRVEQAPARLRRHQAGAPQPSGRLPGGAYGAAPRHGMLAVTAGEGLLQADFLVAACVQAAFVHDARF
jgi:hypothetical protein